MAKPKKDMYGVELPEEEKEGKESKEGKEPSEGKAEGTPVPAEFSPPERARKYKVLATKQVSLDGHIHILAKDTVIDETHYGKPNVERMKAAGVELQEIE